MSSVIAAPEMIGAAATDLATIGSNLSAAHAAAGGPTLALVPAAADEVSAAIAQVFSQHAQGYQALAGQAAAFHEHFVQNMTSGAGLYAAAEAANAAVLQPLNAVAGSSVNAAQGLIVDLLTAVNTVIGQLLNSLTGFWNWLVNKLIDTLGYISFLIFLAVFASLGLVTIGSGK